MSRRNQTMTIFPYGFYNEMLWVDLGENLE
jgi:hypothetical protein